MYQGQIALISNGADWISPFCQIVLDDGTIINILNTDVAFDCSVTISGDGNYQGPEFGISACNPIISGSIADGTVIASAGDDGPGFQWKFSASSLACLRPGTYRFGVKTTTNGQVLDLVDGTLAVVQGNPSSTSTSSSSPVGPPAPPAGQVYLTGSDGAFLTGNA